MSTSKNTTANVVGHDWKMMDYPHPPPIADEEDETWICTKCDAVWWSPTKPLANLRVNLPGIQMPDGRAEVSCDEAIVYRIMGS
jgi:hypothetical protein